MFYYIISTTYQKIGDLFWHDIFLDFRTVWLPSATSNGSIERNLGYNSQCAIEKRRKKNDDSALDPSIQPTPYSTDFCLK